MRPGRSRRALALPDGSITAGLTVANLSRALPHQEVLFRPEKRLLREASGFCSRSTAIAALTEMIRRTMMNQSIAAQ